MSVQKCLNLPLTHNSQPATQNLPFYCPLKVGSGQHCWRIHSERADAVAVPSRSGRDLARELLVRLNPVLSPSPQGRVGTHWVSEEDLFVKLSPSPQGRVGTAHIVASSRTSERSPSPQGRVGTLYTSFVSRLPSRSPSPQGRVGTPLTTSSDCS